MAFCTIRDHILYNYGDYTDSDYFRIKQIIPSNINQFSIIPQRIWFSVCVN